MRIFDRIGAAAHDPHTQERRQPRRGASATSAGATFGRGSAFAGSMQKAQEEGGTLGREPSEDKINSFEVIWPEDEPPEYKRIIPGELKIYSRTARVSEGGDPEAGTYVDVDRFHRAMFFFTEFPAKPYPSTFQPSFTTYYDLWFDLHPPENETELD